jgi:hypothetical protein
MTLVDSEFEMTSGSNYNQYCALLDDPALYIQRIRRGTYGRFGFSRVAAFNPAIRPK